jgi:hypothetical protein
VSEAAVAAAPRPTSGPICAVARAAVARAAVARAAVARAAVARAAVARATVARAAVARTAVAGPRAVSVESLITLRSFPLDPDSFYVMEHMRSSKECSRSRFFGERRIAGTQEAPLSNHGDTACRGPPVRASTGRVGARVVSPAASTAPGITAARRRHRALASPENSVKDGVRAEYVFYAPLAHPGWMNRNVRRSRQPALQLVLGSRKSARR